MPLYNQTLYTSISIARTMDEMNRLTYEKAREDLILQVCKMYYLGQVTAEQIALIKANITRLEELQNITQAFYDNGMAMEVDVKRVNINLENLKVQYDNAQAMLEQQLNLLKYIIDYPAEKQIALVPVDTETITRSIDRTFGEPVRTPTAAIATPTGGAAKEDDWLRIHPFPESDGQLDVFRLHR